MPLKSPEFIELLREPSLNASSIVGWLQHRRSQNPDDLAQLILQDFCHPTILRTLDLISKNLISQPSIEMLLTPNGFQLYQQWKDAASKDSTASGVVAVTAANIELTTDVPHPISPRRMLTPELIHWPTIRSEISKPDSPARTPIPKVGDVLGRCLITGSLGRGGHGIVFSALHQTLNMPVAIKVLTESKVDDGIRQRLREEAQLLARLNHPNIVRVLDYEDGDRPYVVMECVEGPSLSDLIVQTGGLRPIQATKIIRQTAKALEAAWALGIVHRDIKPGNILLTKSGIAKLADLGLAVCSKTYNSEERTGPRTPVGTIAYISVEQARGDDSIDWRSDMYSLGATFYHAILGRLPFPGKSTQEVLMKHMTQQLVPPHISDPDLIDQATSEIIVRMMEKNPDDRFDSYAELIRELRNAQPLASQATVDLESLSS